MAMNARTAPMLHRKFNLAFQSFLNNCQMRHNDTPIPKVTGAMKNGAPHHAKIMPMHSDSVSEKNGLLWRNFFMNKEKQARVNSLLLAVV